MCGGWEGGGVSRCPPSPSAILYLNGDFDGGNFYFTELDAKTVTVSVLVPIPGRQKPTRRSGQNGQSSKWPALPSPNQGGLRRVPFLFGSGLWEARLRSHPVLDPSDPSPPEGRFQSLSCAAPSLSPLGRGAAPVRKGRGILFGHRKPTRSEGCHERAALCHRPVVHSGCATQ